ncbi:hypothetical protein [Spiroplasma endosymbiont of Thecophora atra]|uniref:hypothetical protein n=1 Tax=Spiroplasma endosymbiont of Thecophora atra TaxID=3066294 RepID=UPI0030CDF9A1
METNKKSQPETITNKITADFIQAQLTGEIKELFNKSSFKFNQITIADHKLNADDLKKATTLKAKINYNYDTITNAETNLQITVNDKLKLVDVITNTEVEGRNANNNIVIIPEVLSLNNNSGVVKEDLEIKEFNSASINNPGHAILTAKPESNFTGDVKITITKLINPKEEDLINAFKKTFNHLPEWSRKISDDDTAEQWLKQIKPIAESIAYGVLRDWGWKDWYDPNKLKLHEATVDGRNLTDDDLERKDKNDKYINIDIRFDYGDVKNDIITATLIKRFPPAEPY